MNRFDHNHEIIMIRTVAIMEQNSTWISGHYFRTLQIFQQHSTRVSEDEHLQRAGAASLQYRTLL